MSDAANVVAADHPQDQHGQTARFGVFELDVRAGELRRDGVKVKLQDQPFKLLTLLIENAGAIVTREDLHAKLWPNEFVDFDHSLNAAIRKLRAALDDSADNPRFVETLARRGYRFIAPVQWGTTDAPPATTTIVRRRSGLAFAIAAVALLIAIATTIVVVQQRNTAQNAIDGIAVLPFSIDDKQSQHVGEGLTELIIDGLSKLPNLRVMARTTSFRYKPDADPVQVARDLNVRALVTGAIRRERDEYAIRVELVKSDGTQIWGRRFTARTDDLPVLQREISEDLAIQLRRTNDPAHGQIAARGVTTNAQAYDWYLWGLFAWSKRNGSDLQKALEYFNNAIKADPQFAGAYAGVANVYGVMVGYGMISPEEGAPKVLAAARRALDFDPENAEALTSIATTEFRTLWDFSAAERDYRRAIASNPSYPTAHQWYSDLLRVTGRIDEARREIDTAYKLDPFSPPVNAAKCASLYFERRFADAVAFNQRLMTVDKNLVHTKCYTASLLAMGDAEGALRALQQLAPAAVSAALIDGVRQDGRRGFNRARLQMLLQQPHPETSKPVEIAEAYAQLGDGDQAFAWLEKAYNHRVSQVTSIAIDPELEPIRNDPRFSDLLRRIGLPDVHRPAAQVH